MCSVRAWRPLKMKTLVPSKLRKSPTQSCSDVSEDGIVNTMKRPETSVTSYQSSLRKIPEHRRRFESIRPLCSSSLPVWEPLCLCSLYTCVLPKWQCSKIGGRVIRVCWCGLTVCCHKMQPASHTDCCHAVCSNRAAQRHTKEDGRTGWPGALLTL
jgi:hypothetical protein